MCVCVMMMLVEEVKLMMKSAKPCAERLCPARNACAPVAGRSARAAPTGRASRSGSRYVGLCVPPPPARRLEAWPIGSIEPTRVPAASASLPGGKRLAAADGEPSPSTCSFHADATARPPSHPWDGGVHGPTQAPGVALGWVVAVAFPPSHAWKWNATQGPLGAQEKEANVTNNRSARARHMIFTRTNRHL